MIYCSNCGKENAEDAKYCTSCGKAMGDQAASLENEPMTDQNNQGENKTVFAILGWVFAAISLLFFPVLFGAGGVIFGYLHRKSNQTHGTIIIIASIACAVFGTLLGAAVGGA